MKPVIRARAAQCNKAGLAGLIEEDCLPRPESRLASLLDSLMTHQPITPDVRGWLIKAFIHYLHHGGSLPLDRFLGLGPVNSGERSLSTRLAMLKRDVALLEALDCIALDEAVSDWGRCERLEKEVAQFEAHAWKLYRRSPHPPERWPQWQQALFRAFKSGRRVPRTARGLFEVLKQGKGISVRSPGIKLLASLTRIQDP